MPPASSKPEAASPRTAASVNAAETCMVAPAQGPRRRGADFAGAVRCGRGAAGGFLVCADDAARHHELVGDGTAQRRRRAGMTLASDGDLQENIAGARERVRRALAAVGPELAGVLIDVCCHLKGLEEATRGRLAAAGGEGRAAARAHAARASLRHRAGHGSLSACRRRAALGQRRLSPAVRHSRRVIAAYAVALEVIAPLASALMRATIAAKPLERCGVKCSRRPSESKMGMASVARISSARLPS